MRTIETGTLIRFATPLAMTLLIVASMPVPTPVANEWRTIDGTGNNTVDPERGSVGMHLIRLAGHNYDDLVEEPAGPRRPSARHISNEIAAETEVRFNSVGGTDYVWLWGQFLDHDLDLSPSTDDEPMAIEVPYGDPWFDPARTGTQTIGFTRSTYDHTTGRNRNNPRRQLNMITSWIDASNVYGSDPVRAHALRRNRGKGLLKTSPGKLLPYNTEGLENAGGPSPSLFLAGDIRANEQVALTAMHVLWVREHNRLAKKIRRDNPGLSGDEIYERARAYVGALMQSITYNEFLPVLLGPVSLPTYRDWDPWVDGSIAQEFSTGAYRFGHSMVSPTILRVDRRGREIREGHLSLADAFFRPDHLAQAGIEPILRGLCSQLAREIDNQIVDELRNFLFGPPGAGGFDLASFNIQRGRDHGLASLNGTRMMFGLRPYQDWVEITTDDEIAKKLEEVYGDIDDIDLWVGGLAEDHIRGSLLGETFHAIVLDQFQRLRDGDRFFYKRVFRGNELREIERTTLADVVRRNTTIGSELGHDVFTIR